MNQPEVSRPSMSHVIRKRRRKMTWAVLETEFAWVAKKKGATQFIDQLSQNKVTRRCHREPAIATHWQ